MAWYKHPADVHNDATNTDAYNVQHRPGATTPYSGIYQCQSCGIEVVSERGNPLPPTHAAAAQGHIVTWRLVVYANHAATR